MSKDYIKFFFFVILSVTALTLATLFFLDTDIPISGKLNLPARVAYQETLSRVIDFEAPDGYLYEGEQGAMARMSGKNLRYTLRALPLDLTERTFKVLNSTSFNLAKICVSEGGQADVNTVYNLNKRGGRVVYTCSKAQLSEMGVVISEPGSAPEDSTLITWMLSVEGIGMDEASVKKVLFEEYEKIKPTKVRLNQFPVKPLNRV